LKAEDSLLALPLALADGNLQTLPPVQSTGPFVSFQTALSELEALINPWTPLYLTLRRKGSLIAITFAPYLTKALEREFFLGHRLELVRQLGEANFSQSLICKEVGEITDARSWDERDENSTSGVSTVTHENEERACEGKYCKGCRLKDLGYKRNKCRLCDRRMKNKITHEALDALASLSSLGTAVQIVSLHVAHAPRLYH
jgi:twinfilin-like protein